MTRPLDSVYQLSTYDYPLNSKRVAQYPLNERGHTRLAVLDRSAGSFNQRTSSQKRLVHRFFPDLPQYLMEGDVLVLNDTRVMPVRLMARKMATEGRVEILLVRVASGGVPGRWEVIIKGNIKAGCRLYVGSELELRIMNRGENGYWLADLLYRGDLQDVLDRVGLPPLPPYIRRPPLVSDRHRYQTVYSRSRGSMEPLAGSIAAPTAGIHFTEALLDEIRSRGVKIVFVTLHIGPGTFRPVRSSDIRHHAMENEYYEIPEETAYFIEEARALRRRIIAVGTSTTRALEAAAGKGREIKTKGMTDLFIFPGYRFRMVQGLVTNFHMPKSTLFMLVSSFAGIDVLKKVYREAAEMDYRFLSYGDAMLIH